MHIKSIKTHRVTYGDTIEDLLDKYVVPLSENSIVAVTSKIISVMEGRYIKKSDIDKYQLIKQEADFLLQTDKNPYDVYLTIKEGLLIPSAGIDESNVDNVYVLYPSNPWLSVEKIWQYLREKYNIRNLGIIITDSHTTVMRKGVTGIALSWCGFEPLYSYIGKPDLYEQHLKMTQINIVDALTISAVFLMGEGNERTPISVITDAPYMTFLNRAPSPEERASVVISPEEDLYAPLLKGAQWESKSDIVEDILHAPDV